MIIKVNTQSQINFLEFINYKKGRVGNRSTVYRRSGDLSVPCH